MKQKSNQVGSLGKFLFYLSILILVYILGVATVIVYNNSKKEIFIYLTNIDSKNEIVNRCSSLDLFFTSQCLNKEVKTFFYYNITNLGKDLTFEQLKKEGGVCSHYTAFFVNIGERLGFNSTIVSIFPNEIGHSFAVLFDNTGYCLLDQDVEPICLEVKYQNVAKENKS